MAAVPSNWNTAPPGGGAPPRRQQQQQQQWGPPGGAPPQQQQQQQWGPPGGAPPAPPQQQWNSGPSQRAAAGGQGQQQQQYQQQEQQQQHGGIGQQQGMPNMGAMADSFQSEMSKHNPMAGMAVGYGRAFMQGQVTRFLPSGVAGLGGSFKYYFHVDNRYITSKLRLLLFPFRRHSKEQWTRVSDGDGGPGCTFQPPSEDINAPDMYLPLMSFVTYSIVVAFVMGTAGEFTPDVLYSLIQSCAVYLLLEVMAIRLGFFLVQMSCSLLDLFAITGYKFVGLAINMVIGYLFGKGVYYIALAYTGSAMAFFMIKTLSAIKTSADDKQRRKMLLLLIGGMQIVLMWWLGYSGHLNQAHADAAAGPPASAPAAPLDAPLSAAAAAAALKGFTYNAGFLGAKNEVEGLKDGKYAVDAAAALCAKHKNCGGFTYEGAKEPAAPVAVSFKTAAGAAKVTKSDTWHAYQKKS